MKNISRYYTPQQLAHFLVNECGSIKPKSVIDICAGSWNLLNAANKRWKECDSTGVDIDSSSKNSIIQDGRYFAYGCFTKNKQFDLVLANPPFHHDSDNKEISKIIRDIIPYKFNGHVLSRIESTMMIFNSLIVNRNGTLAAIVPNGIINSQTQHNLRIFLANKFNVEKIIKLPGQSFEKDIFTSIIILRNTNKRTNTKLYTATIRYDGSYSCNLETSLLQNDVKKGVWEIFETERESQARKVTIIRNNITSSQLHSINSGVPVIHSSSFNDSKIDHKKLKFSSYKPYQMHKTMKDDIVLVRVGRNSGKYAIITEKDENIATSDCILIIRNNGQETIRELIKILNSEKLTRIIKGVTTKYISMSELKILLG